MPDGDDGIAGEGATETVDPDGTANTAARSEDRVAGRSPERYARLLEALDAGVYVLDPEGSCTFVDDDLCALTGYDRETLVGAGPQRVVEEETVADIERAVGDRLGGGRESFTVDRDVTVHRADGANVPCHARMIVLRDEAGTVEGIVGLLRDVSGRERRENLLARLQETTRSLMQAPTRETVADIVADAAVDRLGFGACVVRLYDADERTLVPVACAGDGDDVRALPTLDLDGSPQAAAFTSGEPEVCVGGTGIESDGEAGDGTPHDPTADGPFADAGVCAVLYNPMGVHGTLALGTDAPGGFDDVDRQITGVLATNAAAACNRAKREREVRDAREHVATIVDRIEGLVEKTIEVLVAATTREDVERGVCERLAATDPYVSAWIARPDVRETGLEPTRGAGRADDSFADGRIDLDGDDPGAVAYREGVSRVVDADALAAAGSGWLAAAHARGIGSAVAVPLAHRRANYGVLFVCAAEPAAFDERELVVLEALGQAVADAIDAIESGRILDTDEVVELSIAVEGGTLLDRVAAATDASLATAGTMSEGGGKLRLFLTATGADAPAVEAALAADDAIAEVSLVAVVEEECLFDLALADSIVDDLVDRGAVPKRLAAEGEVTRLTVEVSDERAARKTFTFVEERCPGATLVGYRGHERPVRTRQEFRASLAEQFTDRQETALRTAYHGGFFDWPRGADGDELATSMDISRPTYHQHLRAAQRKVFEQLFEPESELRE